ncbi:MAG: ABC transporter substrate-binding protein [Oscillospiraceae bacterium]|nr:ABC transporter substrate-binding protein [Oscillospiraceae bacterium]MCL2278920.1 ABC transporter substrate-binding protein [Oscillospiraceae bacterium]
MAIKKRFLTLALTLALLFGVAACGASPAENGDAQADSGSTVEASITVIDQAGRSVEIAQPVERLVSGFYISSSATIALGLSDRLVGIEARADERPVYTLMKPELLSLPNVGTARDFNLEACIALYPDLVILPYRLRDAAETLTDMGIPAIVVNPESLEELVAMINLIATATQTTENANRLVAWIRDTHAAVTAESAVVADRPTVYIAGVGSHLSTAPGGMFQSDLIEMAGGINVAADLPGRGWTEISYEQLLAMNPDIIVLPSEASYSVDDILNNPTLADLTAAVNGSVYQMPYTYEAWDSPVPASMLGARWLLAVLHGNSPGDEFMRYVYEFYAEFYGFDGLG